jgi:hypothetical protein
MRKTQWAMQMHGFSNIRYDSLAELSKRTSVTSDAIRPVHFDFQTPVFSERCWTKRRRMWMLMRMRMWKRKTEV